MNRFTGLCLFGLGTAGMASSHLRGAAFWLSFVVMMVGSFVLAKENK